MSTDADQEREGSTTSALNVDTNHRSRSVERIVRKGQEHQRAGEFPHPG